MKTFHRADYSNGVRNSVQVIAEEEYLELSNSIGLMAIGGSVCYMDADSVSISKEGFVYGHYTVNTPKRFRQVVTVHDATTNKLIFKLYSNEFK